LHIRIYKEVLIKEYDILKKPYLAPRIEFEEIEEDEREMLMAPSYGGVNQGGSGKDPDLPDDPNSPFSLDADLGLTSNSSDNSDDFLINDY